VLLGVLPDASNRGNQNIYNYLPTKLNGKDIVDFKQFYKEIQSMEDGFINLEDALNRKVIIAVKRAKESQKRILRTYNIQYDKSSDLREDQK